MSIEAYPSQNGVLTSLIWRKTMSGGETSLSGYDNASQALSYTPGQEQVYLNGILLVRGDDYTATNGTSITGLSALAASDFIQVNCYNNFSVASVPATSITGTIANDKLANSSITINGSAISLGGSVTLAGDIESVTASSPLTGGGSTGALTVGIQSASTTQAGAVQLSDSTSTTSSVLAATPTAVKSAYDLANAAIPKTLTTTTGDIIYASSANTPARLGIGSTGQVLGVSGGVPTWSTPTGGSHTLLSTTTLSASTTTVSGINQTYKHLYIEIYGILPTAFNPTINYLTNATALNFNVTQAASATSVNYYTTSGTVGNGQNYGGNMAGANKAAIMIYDYTDATYQKVGSFNQYWRNEGGSWIYFNGQLTTGHNTALTSFSMTVSTGSYTSGTIKVYGVN